MLGVLAGTGLALFDGWAFSSALDHHAARQSPGVFEVAVLSVPVLLIGYGLLCSAPGWNAKDRRGSAHFSKPRVRDVFLASEWSVVGASAVAALILGGWGLHRYGDSGWSYLWLATAGLTLAMWWLGSRALLNRPSRAATSLELQWDDLLRYQRVRDFTLLATCGPAAYVALLDAMADGFNLAVIPVVGVLAILAFAIFRRGRDLWRRPWAAATN